MFGLPNIFVKISFLGSLRSWTWMSGWSRYKWTSMSMYQGMWIPNWTKKNGMFQPQWNLQFRLWIASIEMFLWKWNLWAMSRSGKVQSCSYWVLWRMWGSERVWRKWTGRLSQKNERVAFQCDGRNGWKVRIEAKIHWNAPRSKSKSFLVFLSICFIFLSFHCSLIWPRNGEMQPSGNGVNWMTNPKINQFLGMNCFLSKHLWKLWNIALETSLTIVMKMMILKSLFLNGQNVWKLMSLNLKPIVKICKRCLDSAYAAIKVFSVSLF